MKLNKLKKRRRNNDIRISIKNSLLHVSGLQKQKGTVKTMMKWSHEEEEEEEEDDDDDDDDNRAKRGPRGLWKQDLVDDLVDIIITNDYYQRKPIFVNTKNQQNGKVYEKVLKELKSRAGEIGRAHV